MGIRIICATVLIGIMAAACVAGAENVPGSDSVTIQPGERITGRITGLGADGLLRITASYMERETVLRAAAIRGASFTPTAKEADPHLVLLTNGDRVAGTVSAVTATQVMIESSAAGKLTIDRAFVQSIRFRPVKSDGVAR
jgi:hypothetical protein